MLKGINMKAQQQEQAPYFIERQAIQTVGEDDIIRQALAIMQRRLQNEREAFHTPNAVRTYLSLNAERRADKNVEIFCVMFLDSQSKLIKLEEMFTGTLNQTSVYPREVVRRALHHNAAAVVLSHNHPSGSVQPSRADELLTLTLKASLALVDVRVLDHIITGEGGQTLSMAEQGMM
jgi:DNA repair protein RadC